MIDRTGELRHLRESMNDLTRDLFHCCALVAFVTEAQAAGGWPDSELTRRRAYALYAQELQNLHRGK